MCVHVKLVAFTDPCADKHMIVSHSEKPSAKKVFTEVEIGAFVFHMLFR